MRKNAPRKWIHAILDLLPLLVIPIFTIYSQCHTVDSYIVQVEETKIVDFNQLLNPDSLSDNSEYLSIEQYKIIFNGTNDTDSVAYNFFYNSSDFIENHFYYFDGGVYSLAITYFNDTTTYTTISETGIIFQNISSVSLYKQLNVGSTFNNEIITPFYIDLTQMFGIGNEPTLEQFKSAYPSTYYDYTLSKKEFFYTGNTLFYNDTDIGSQFIYQMYNVTDKYFNFNSLFNMQSVYEWLQLNLFGGNAPLPVTIVWNIIVYEFFIDSIFLLYSVFMFFIDFATNTLQKFLDRSR